MSLGLIYRAVRETRVSTLSFAAGLFVFELLVGMMLATFHKEFSDKFLPLEFIQKMFAALLGAEVGTVGPAVLSMLGWIHPIVLALVWAHAIVVCTRVPAGEVDRGTLDVLLALPVTRTSVYVSESVVFILAGLLVVGAGLGGNVVGNWISGLERVGSLGQLSLVALNLYALSLAAGGMSAFLSSVCDRRGRAMGAAFAILMASLFLSSMSTFNALVKTVSVVSLLNYYRPYGILQGQASPLGDMIVLLGLGLGLWICGLTVFIRRDIRAA
jgi:ABC-type transport system involved in multi-copper enzyme maturation permease subunit